MTNRILPQNMKAQGFTLAELMVATLILVIVLVGMLASYVTCMELADLSRNTSTAINIAQAKVEEIKNDTYINIQNDYDPAGNGVPFNIVGLTGRGVTYVNATNPDLLRITVTVCWRQKNGRVIGEDTNLSGQLDAGEDRNGNVILDSVAQVITFIARR
jgi:prepilin-type N-terminal cleavage/methylation domain-containing protein